MDQDTVGRPMEILLVEDSLLSGRLTMATLKKGNIQHRLTWITDGAEALEFLRREGKFARAPQPDLILLDLGLPGKDGREVLSEIKADDDLKRIPVVVMTASTDAEDALYSEKLQVESFLTKPVDLKKFIDVVRQLSRFWRDDLILPSTETR